MGLTDNWDRGRVYGTFLTADLKGLASGSYKVVLNAYATNSDDDNIMPGGVIESGQLNTNLTTLDASGKARSIDVVVPLVDDASITPNPAPIVVEINLTNGIKYTYAVAPTAGNPAINLRTVVPQAVVKATVQTLKAGALGTRILGADTVEQVEALLPGLDTGGVDTSGFEARIVQVEDSQESLGQTVLSIGPQVSTNTNAITQLAQQQQATAATASNAEAAAAGAYSTANTATQAAAEAAASAAAAQQYGTRIGDLESNVWEVQGDETTIQVEVLTEPAAGVPGVMRMAYAGSPYDTLTVFQASDGTWPDRPTTRNDMTVQAVGHLDLTNEPTWLASTDAYMQQSSTAATGGGASVGSVVSAMDTSGLSFGRTWAFCGDSITQGSGTTNTWTYGYPNVAQLLAGGRLVRNPVLNHGVAGEPSSGLLARVPAIIAAKPDACFVLIGTNDTDLAAWKTNVKAIKAAFDAQGIPSVWGTIPPRGAPTAAEKQMIAAQNAWLKLWSVAAGVQLADVHSALVDPATGNYVPALTSDGVHPSNAGHAAVAAVVAAAIGRAMRPTPWLATSAGLGKLSDPTNVGTAGGGWDIWAGPQFPTRSFTAAVNGDVPAGRWQRWTFPNVATTSSAAVGVSAGAASVAPGDKLLVAMYVRGSYNGAIDKVGIMNGADASVIDLIMDNPPTATPGPILSLVTVPAGVTEIGLKIFHRSRAGQGDWIEFGGADIFNLTQLGITDMA